MQLKIKPSESSFFSCILLIAKAAKLLQRAVTCILPPYFECYIAFHYLYSFAIPSTCVSFSCNKNHQLST